MRAARCRVVSGPTGPGTHTAGSGEQNTTLDRTGHFDLAKVEPEDGLHHRGRPAAQRRRGDDGEPAVEARPDDSGRASPPCAQPAAVARRPDRARAPRADHRRPGRRGPAVGRRAPARAPHVRTPRERRRSSGPRRTCKGAAGVRPSCTTSSTAHLGRPDVLGEAGLAEYEAIDRGAAAADRAEGQVRAADQRPGPPTWCRWRPRGNGRTTVARRDPRHAGRLGARGRGARADSARSGGGRTPGASSSTGNHARPGDRDRRLRRRHRLGQPARSASRSRSSPPTPTAPGWRPPSSRRATWSRSGSRSCTTSRPTRPPTRAAVRRRPSGPTQLTDVAGGEYYVKMLKHEYLEGLRQMEEGASTDAVLADARLQAVPPKLGRPDLEATEYGEGPSGPVHQPYRPLLQALTKAKAERRTVVLAVRETDGTERRLRGVPRTGRCGVRRRRWLRLGLRHACTATWCGWRRVGSTCASSTTPRRRTAASAPRWPPRWRRAACRPAVLKGLDYATTAREFAPAPSRRPAKRSAAAGRTIAPTGHGPSLSGP